MRRVFLKMMLIVASLVFCPYAKAQKQLAISDSVNWAIKKLMKYGCYNLYDNNGWSSTPAGWLYQQIIIRNASDERLITMTSSKVYPAVRLTAMEALIRRRNHRCKDIMLANLNDVSRCTIQACDVIFGEYVENLFIEWVQGSKKDSLIAEVDSIRNDSTILFTKGTSRFLYVNELVLRLPCNEKYY